MQFEIVQFHNDQIEAIRGADGRGFVVIKRICENLGVAYEAQFTKLKNAHWSGITTIVMPDTRGREQSHSVIPVDSLPMWLVKIEPSRIAEPLRDKLRRYQLEARDVLARHFNPPIVAASTLDPRLVQIELLGELIRKQIETEQRLDSIEATAASAVAKADLAITTVSGATDFLSVLGYCKTRNIVIPEPKMAQAGKAAAGICKLEGIEYRQSHHERWGSVGIYPITVLDRVFDNYRNQNGLRVVSPA